ncbi:hypothetical protein GmHk_20G057873 [Glycine max]|nr:hypothetical protein GmHk_20G057873 [Glycine max]
MKNRDQLPHKDFAALKSRERISNKEENKSPTKALKVRIIESEASDDSSIKSIDDEVTLMSKNFKKIRAPPQKKNDTTLKKKHKEESNEIICFECRKSGHMTA